MKIVKGSIKRRLVFSYSFLLSIVLIIFVGTNVIITNNIIKANTKNYAIKTIEETSNNVDMMLNKAVYFSRLVGYNTDIQKLLVTYKSLKENSVWDDLDLQAKINKVIANFYTNQEELGPVEVYFSPGCIFSYSNENIDRTALNNTMDINSFTILGKTNIQWIPDFNYYNIASAISMRRLIVNTETLERIGVMVINIPVTYINGLLGGSQVGKTWGVFMINDCNIIISAKDVNYVGKPLHLDKSVLNQIHRENCGSIETKVDGQAVIVIFNTSVETGWKTIGVVPLMDIYMPTVQNQAVLILIGIVGVFIIIMMSTATALSITRPIDKIRNAMKDVGRGNLNIMIIDNNYIETAELSQGFNKMQKNLNDLIQKEYIMTLKNKEAEFNTLQAQINPHFLFNALDTINCMLYEEEKYDLSSLIQNLGDILRYSISRGKNVVKLKTDLEYIEKYLYIQKMRFGDKLSYEISACIDSMDCIVLKFILQPLVENAIVHGIEKKRGKGCVKITSAIEGGKLNIVISDDGIGISEEKLSSLLNITDEKEGIKHLKLGVQSVYKRLKLFYGDEYGLFIESQPGTGTTVRVLLPEIYDSGIEIS